MSLKTWAGFQEYRRITPMALFALRAAADAGRPRSVRSLAGLATAPGFSSPTPLHVAEHRLQAEQAGIAQGAQFVEADAGEDFHAAQPIGAAQGLLQLAGTAGRALAPTVEALPLMVCKVAALPGHRPRRAGVRAGRRGPACPERSAATWTISSGLPPGNAPTMSRASTSSPASAAVAGAPTAPLLPR